MSHKSSVIAIQIPFRTPLSFPLHRYSLGMVSYLASLRFLCLLPLLVMLFQFYHFYDGVHTTS